MELETVIIVFFITSIFSAVACVFIAEARGINLGVWLF